MEGDEEGETSEEDGDKAVGKVMILTEYGAERSAKRIVERRFLQKGLAVQARDNEVLLICHLSADAGDLRLVWSPESVLYPREQRQEENSTKEGDRSLSHPSALPLIENIPDFFYHLDDIFFLHIREKGQ